MLTQEQMSMKFCPNCERPYQNYYDQRIFYEGLTGQTRLIFEDQLKRIWAKAKEEMMNPILFQFEKDTRAFNFMHRMTLIDGIFMCPYCDCVEEKGFGDYDHRERVEELRKSCKGD